VQAAVRPERKVNSTSASAAKEREQSVKVPQR